MLKKLSRRWRWILALIVGAAAVGGVAFFLPNVWLVASTADRLHWRVEEAPSRPVALVLGTSSKRPGGAPNLHFERRLDAAAALFQEGRVRRILVSGDNRTHRYNEPEDMAAGLIRRGVPDNVIVRDYAGLRTLDSVVRAREVFQVTSCIIVTDGWHLPRALFIAEKTGLEAVGVASRDVPLKWSWKTRGRESLARVLTVLDLYLWDTQPRHGASGDEPTLLLTGGRE